MFDPETEAKLQRTIPVRPPPLTYYMPNPKPIAAIVPVPLKPEYDSYDDLPVVEDFVSNLSELPDLEDFEHDTLEIESDNDLPELEDFVSDSDEIRPLEDIPYGSPVPSNEPSRRIVSQYVQDQHSAEFAYFNDPIMCTHDQVLGI